MKLKNLRYLLPIFLFSFLLSSSLALETEGFFTETFEGVFLSVNGTSLQPLNYGDSFTDHSFRTSLNNFYTVYVGITGIPFYSAINFSVSDQSSYWTYENKNPSALVYHDGSTRNRSVTMLFDFDYPLKVDNDTVISFLSNLSNTSGQGDFAFALIDSSDVCQYVITSNNGAFVLPFESFCSPLSDGATIGKVCVNASLSQFSNAQPVVSSYPFHDCGFPDSTEISKIAFFEWEAGAGVMIFDDISLSNFSYGDNEMPQILSLNISTSQCFNTSRQIVNNISVDLSIAVSDSENDTIYYGVKADEDAIFTTGSFSSTLEAQACLSILPFPVFGWNPQYCASVPTASIVQTVQPTFKVFHDSCQILTNYSEFYVDDNTDKDNQILPMLFYNPNCDKYTESYLDLKTDIGYLSDFSYITDLYILNSPGTEFNLTFYNNPDLDIYNGKFNFLVNETDNLRVNYVNDTGIVYLGRFNLSDSHVGLNAYVSLNVEYNQGTNAFNITYGTESLSYTNSSLRGVYDSGLLTKYIGLSIKDDTLNFVWQSGFFYGGRIFDPVFSLSLPSSVNVYGDGLSPITIYVTDDSHLLEDDFTYEYTELYVPLCEFDYSGSGQGILSGNQDEQSNPTKFWFLIRFAKLTLGDTAKSFLLTFPTLGDYTLWDIFIGVLGFFLFLEFLGLLIITKGLSTPLTVVGLEGLFISLILTYVVGIITFGILTAIGISIPSARDISGRDKAQ